MKAAGLFKLPNELLVHIASYVEFDDPKALGGLTRTCQRLHDCCKSSVAARQELERQHWAIHDRDPLTVPKLLYAASQTSGPLREAWHIRRAEFWYHRISIGQWCDLKDFHHTEYSEGSWDEDASSNDPNEVDSETGEEWFNHELDAEIKEERAVQAEGREIIHRDKETYRRFLGNVFHVEKETIESLLSEVDNGEEELQKALLLPFCSRLDTLIFVA